MTFVKKISRRIKKIGKYFDELKLDMNQEVFYIDKIRQKRRRGI